MKGREILDQLVAEGKITEVDIVNAEGKALTSDRKKVIEFLHTKFCNLNHDSGQCKWYEEEEFRSPWSGKFHQEWARLFNDFLASTKLVKLIPENDSMEPLTVMQTDPNFRIGGKVIGVIRRM